VRTIRWITREIGAGQSVEFPIADDGPQARIIIIEAVENAEPVLAVVDLQAFERREAVVGLDDRVGDDDRRFCIRSRGVSGRMIALAMAACTSPSCWAEQL